MELTYHLLFQVNKQPYEGLLLLFIYLFFLSAKKEEPLQMENHTRYVITSNKGKDFGEEPNPKGKKKAEEQNTDKENQKQNRKLNRTSTADTAERKANFAYMDLTQQIHP